MTKYVLTYHGGNHEMPTNDAEMEQLMGDWGRWFAQLGSALLDGGNPFGPRTALASDGTLTNGGVAPDLNGFGVIEASDMEAAVELAKGCPVLAGGATVQISEALEM